MFRRTNLGSITRMDNPEVAATFQVTASETKNINVSSTTPKEELFDLLHTELTSDQWKRLLHLLNIHRDIFASFSKNLGNTTVVKHTIDTLDHPPIKLRLNWVSNKQRQIIDTHVQDMLERDVSSLGLPSSYGQEKDGSDRFCVEYRKLNNITVKDSYSLPRIDDTIDFLHGAAFYSSMELQSGYRQVSLCPSAREKSAFVTYRCLWEFKTMPFGSWNDPATFQRLMESFLKRLNQKIVLCYLDDIIYIESFPKHLKIILTILALKEANIKLKPSRCNCACTNVEYLGHVITKDRIRPNPNKLTAVTNFPRPKTVRDVKCFLGLCNCYRQFVRSFAKIASPLNKLTRKTKSLSGQMTVKKAFTQIKHLY